MKRRILIFISNICAKHISIKYHKESYYFIFSDTFQAIGQWLCSKVGGHNLERDWSYGPNNDYVEKHCQWCYKRINIPLTPKQKAVYMKSWAISEAWEKAKGGG